MKNNEIIYYNEYAEVIIYDRKGKEKARATIELDDINIIKKYRWSLRNSNGYLYAITNTTHSKKWVRMHRLIMSVDDSRLVDHINHNTLDNRKSNLRISDKSKNSMNMKIKSNNKSGKTGVFWNKKINKWWVYININKKRIHIGYYVDLSIAIEARELAEEKYFGEYSFNNSKGVD